MIRTIIPRSTMNEFRQMEQALDRLFRTEDSQRHATHTISLDVFDHENTLVIRASIPGVETSTLELEIEDDVLSIRGESKPVELGENSRVYRTEINAGRFSRSLRLPENLQVDAIHAEAKEGILTIRLPRAEEVKPQPIKIPVIAVS